MLTLPADGKFRSFTLLSACIRHHCDGGRPFLAYIIDNIYSCAAQCELRLRRVPMEGSCDNTLHSGAGMKRNVLKGAMRLAYLTISVCRFLPLSSFDTVISSQDSR